MAVASAAQRPPLTIFVDALDEGNDNDIRNLIGFLEDLAICASTSSILRICLSSRHYPHITVRKGFSLVVEKQRDYDSDVQTYVQTKFIVSDTTNSNDLGVAVYSKSSDVFLWVVLVISILGQMSDRGKDMAEMMAFLQLLPRDLEGLFAEILPRGASEVRGRVSLLQWVLYAVTPLNSIELYLAIQHGWPFPKEDRFKPPSEDLLARCLLHNSRGLIEVTRPEPRIFQFIHETDST